MCQWFPWLLTDFVFCFLTFTTLSFLLQRSSNVNQDNYQGRLAIVHPSIYQFVSLLFAPITVPVPDMPKTRCRSSSNTHLQPTKEALVMLTSKFRFTLLFYTTLALLLSTSHADADVNRRHGTLNRLIKKRSPFIERRQTIPAFPTIVGVGADPTPSNTQTPVPPAPPPAPTSSTAHDSISSGATVVS
jgi:hypothetical protein